jgi:hypothetical protein
MTNAAAPAFLTSPRARRVWLVVCLAWFAWLVSGIFPITPLEGDEQGVIHGATSLATGDLRYWDMRYLYEIQPGSYVLISRLARLTHWSVDNSFALLSAGGALLFAAGTALLVQRLLRAPWPLVALAVLLSQEIWAGAYYMNTTAVGGWLALLAVLLALRPLTPLCLVAVAVLLAVAGWIRVDCLLISPAVAAIVWWRHRALRPFLREIVPTTLLALAVCALLFASCKVNPLGLPAIYSTRNVEGWRRTFQMYFFVTSSLVGVLSLVGVVLMAWQRQWSLLLVWLGGTALTFMIYGHSLGSDKYFYVAIPFFLLAAVFAAQDILRRWPGWPPVWRYAAAAFGAGLLLFDTVIGVLTSSSEYRLFLPRPRLATLANIPTGRRPIDLTVGSGELIFTADGYRLRGGTLFAPATWRLDKAEIIRRLDDLAGILRAPGDCSLFVSDWLGYELVLRILRQEGFDFTSGYDRGSGYPYTGVWRKDAKSVHLGFLAYAKSIYYDPARQTANPTGTRTYFVGTLGDHGPLAELTDGLHWQLHSPDPYGYIQVHQRR